MRISLIGIVALCLSILVSQTALPGAPPPLPEWVEVAGGNGFDEATAVAPDQNGNVIITGSFVRTCFFGRTNLQTSLNQAAFVAKYTPAGELKWARVANTNLESAQGTGDRGKSLAVDKRDNIYLAAEFQRPVVITNAQSGMVYTNYPGYVFLAKYDPAGNLMWSRTAGGPQGAVTDRKLLVDDDANTYLAGEFVGEVTIGATNLHDRGNGWTDLYVAKYSPDGEPDWTLQGGGADFDFGYGLALTSNHTLVLSGRLGNSSWLNSNTNASQTNILAWLDTNGNVLAVRPVPFASDGGLAIDQDGNLFTGGFTSTPLSAVISKFDFSGTLIWANYVTNAGPNSYDVRSRGLVVDALNRLWAGIQFTGEAAAFGKTNVAIINGGTDALIARYAQSGECEWVGRLGGPIIDSAEGIDTDRFGNTYWVGSFTSEIASFGTLTITNQSKWPDVYIADVFLAKLTPVLPKLDIDIADTGVLLSWPAWGENFELEFRESPPTAAWSLEQSPRVRVDSEFQVILSPSGTTSFFRLRSR